MAANQTGYTLTYVNDSFDDWGKTRTTLYQVAPTASSYYTGGYQITPANVGFRSFYDVVIATQIPAGGTPLTSMIVPIFDITNNALQLFSVKATGSLATLTFTGNPATLTGTYAGNPQSLTGTYAGNPQTLTGTATNPLINLGQGTSSATLIAQLSGALLNGTGAAGTAYNGVTGVLAPTITLAQFTSAGTVTLAQFTSAGTVTIAQFTPGGTVAGGTFVGSATNLTELASAADASGFVFLVRFFGN